MFTFTDHKKNQPLIFRSGLNRLVVSNRPGSDPPSFHIFGTSTGVAGVSWAVALLQTLHQDRSDFYGEMGWGFNTGDFERGGELSHSDRFAKHQENKKNNGISTRPCPSFINSFNTSNTNSTWAISKVPGTLSFLRVFVAKIHGFLRCQGRKSARNGSWISLPRATSMPPRSLRKARHGAAWIEFWHGASHKMVLEADFQPWKTIGKP